MAGVVADMWFGHTSCRPSGPCPTARSAQRWLPEGLCSSDGDIFQYYKSAQYHVYHVCDTNIIATHIDAFIIIPVITGAHIGLRLSVYVFTCHDLSIYQSIYLIQSNLI